jgi:hypothetical protein
MQCAIISEDLLEYGEKFTVNIKIDETHFQFQINGNDYFKLDHQFESFSSDLSVIVHGCKIYDICKE